MRPEKPIIIGDVERKLKKGYTWEKFVNCYNYSSKEDFDEQLKKICYPQKYDEIVARINQNEKRKKKQGVSMKEERYETTVGIKSEVIDHEGDKETVRENETEMINIAENVSAEHPISNANDSENIELSELTEQEEKIREEIIKLELERKEYFQARGNMRKALAENEAILKKLKERVIEIQNNVTSLIQKLNEEYNKTARVNAQIDEKQLRLREIKAQIATLKKISVLMYKSGNIEIEAVSVNLGIPEIPEYSNELLNQIFDNEYAGTLTLNQLKGLARLITYVRLLNEQNIKCDIIFEEENAEKLYHLIMEE